MLLFNDMIRVRMRHATVFLITGVVWRWRRIARRACDPNDARVSSGRVSALEVLRVSPGHNGPHATDATDEGLSPSHPWHALRRGSAELEFRRSEERRRDRLLVLEPHAGIGIGRRGRRRRLCSCALFVGRVSLVWQGNVARGAEEKHVGAVFVLHAEDGPHGSTAYFGEGDEETQYCRMLDLLEENHIENPAVAHGDVEHHGDVVDPCTSEPSHVAQQGTFGVQVAETPIHQHVPRGDVQRVQERERDEWRLKFGDHVDTVHAESGIVQDTEQVLDEVGQVRKPVARVTETS